MLQVGYRPDTEKVYQLVELFDRGDLIVPDLQRKFLLEGRRDKCSGYIESLLLGFVIPPIVVYEEGDRRLSIIDGLQRCRSIYDYIKDKYPLSKLEYIQEYNGKKFSKLPTEMQNLLLRSVLYFNVISSNDPEIKFQLFKRLNSGSTHLKPMEILRGAYPSPLFAAIELIFDPKREPTAIRIQNSFLTTRKGLRYEKEESILRFLIMAKNVKEDWTKASKVDIDEEKMLKSFQDKTSEESNAIIHNIVDVINTTLDVFGEQPFFYKNPKHFNKAVFESLLSSINTVLSWDKGRELLYNNKEKLRSALQSFREGQTKLGKRFDESRSEARTDVRQLKDRYDCMFKTISSVIDKK